MEFHSAVISPKGVWWQPAGKQERFWLGISFIWCMILFAMMPFWHFKGGQNPSGIRSRVEPMQFAERAQRFISEYQVMGPDGQPVFEQGIPVVAPPPGSDVYLMAQMWRWTPVLRLQQGAEYTVHISSIDLNHGFSLLPQNINLQIVPGYDYGIRMTPNVAGDYRIVCNEFCGIGHHTMVGRIVVGPSANQAAVTTEKEESL
jgi:cytochrome c oxidase subunit 2